MGGPQNQGTQSRKKEKDKRKLSDRSDKASGETPEEKKVNRRLSEELEEEIVEEDEAILLEKVGERLRTLRDRDEKMTETLAQVSKIGLLDEKLSGLIRTVEFMSEQMKDLTEELKQAKSVQKKNRFLEQEIIALKNQNKQLKNRLNEQDNYSRRENMEITGIEEAPNESCRAVCNKFFKEGMGIMKDTVLV